MKIAVHPRVVKYINGSGDKERIVEHLKALEDDPFTNRSGADIKKLSGKERDMFRLRIGDHRFEYFVDDDTVWIDEAFRRGRGYR
ncbi:MAG: type II toxin-antitoxin system RelE/ParE family toxin [Candidatus Thermoplasmatota archaeon]|nr:type II toxin-antitoxin system RelE/ParE family toxin [Candidatus Thermoplasmatota archaeon]